MKGISAIVVTYNQQELLAKCLSSIHHLVSEIIVVDLGSDEDIKGIVGKFGGKVIHHEKVNIVETIRQEITALAKYEYILFLDPDESISNSLAKKIQDLVSDGKFDYFEIPRQNFVFGAWVKASRWWPDYQLRLFRKGQLTWSSRLHSKPSAKGVAYRFDPELENAIVHQNYVSLDEWFEKNRRYAKSDAQNRLEAKENFTITEAMRLSISELISRYFVGRGSLDGTRGLLLSILQSFYYFLVYAYYWEGKKYRELESAESLSSFPKNWFSHGLSEIMHWDKSNQGFVKKIKSKFVRKLLA